MAELSTAVVVHDKDQNTPGILHSIEDFPLTAVTKAKIIAGSPQMRHTSKIDDTDVFEVIGVDVHVYVVPPSMLEDV